MNRARFLHICVSVLGTLLMSSLPAFAQAPVPKALREAKTVYLINEGASESMFDGLAKDLQKWGRWELVDDASRADLTVTIGGLKAFKGWPMTIRSMDGTPSMDRYVPEPGRSLSPSAEPESGAVQQASEGARQGLQIRRACRCTRLGRSVDRWPDK